jgi:two-component system LytT family response regulator
MTTTNLSFFIIEDEPMAQEMLKKALEKQTFVTVCGVARDVESAYEGILNSTPDALFLDIKLERGDAFDLLDRLKNNNVEIPPVILMTAYTEFEFAQKALNEYRNKIVRILKKPFMENFQENFQEWRASILAYRQARQQRIANHDQLLSVKLGNITYRLEWKDINYIEVGGSGSIILVTKENGNLQIPQTLSSFMENAPAEILRIHRNNAVNIHIISHIDHDDRLLYLKGYKKGLSIGRTYYPAVMNLL